MKISILLLLVFCIVAQNTNESEQTPTTNETIHERTKEDIMKERDSLQSLLKTLNYSCIVLARMQLSRYKSELMEVIESHQTKSEQHMAWKKIYTTFVSQCQKSITYDDSVKIFTSLRSNEFKFEDYHYVYENMTLAEFKEVDLKFTTAEERIWGYIQDFEKAMNEKDEEDENNQSKTLFDLEPKVFGFSLKSVKSIQYIMLLAFVSLIAFLVYVATKKPEETKTNRKKQKN